MLSWLPFACLAAYQASKGACHLGKAPCFSLGDAVRAPLRAPSSPPETPMPMYMSPFSATFFARASVFSYLRAASTSATGQRKVYRHPQHMHSGCGMGGLWGAPAGWIVAYHSLPPSMMMSPSSRRGMRLSMVASTGAPALTRIITRLQGEDHREVAFPRIEVQKQDNAKAIGHRQAAGSSS